MDTRIRTRKVPLMTVFIYLMLTLAAILIAGIALIVSQEISFRRQDKRIEAHCSEWRELKPRRSLIPWRRWNVVTKIKLRQLRKALDQERRAKARAQRLVRELSRAGHAHS